MKKVTSFGKKALLAAFLCCCSLPGFAEDTQTWLFDAEETAQYAEFFKQPSAIEGKCNAEVLGIDINREGFSWDDMNTWKNSEGKLWRAYSSGYSETLFGVCVNASAPFNYKTSGLTWTTTEGDNQWYPAIASVKDLKGSFTFNNCMATVVHISGTQMEKVKIQMTNEDADCYLHIRRNLQLKELDLSDSNGKCRQLAGYRNAFTDESCLICNNCRQTEFLDWLLNLEDNMYTFSTIPMHPATGKKLESGYKLQWNARGGMPIGYQNPDGEYEFMVDEDIGLSGEYDIYCFMTIYTWKDIDGNVIEPTDAVEGWFCFDESHVGKEYRCEMINEAYPQLALNTVFVKVVDEYTSGIQGATKAAVKVGPNPADDYITIKGAEVLKAQVYSLAGTCVKNVAAGAQKVDIADLTPGMYLIKIVTTEGETTAKFIKK